MLNKRDLVLIVSLVLLSAASLAVIFFTLNRPETGVVQVKIAQELVSEHPLEVDSVYEFTGLYGPLTMEIHDRRVRIPEATCPDQYCVQQGWLDNTSSSIICLPNQVVIDIRGEQELDGISR